MDRNVIFNEDCLAGLARMPDESVQCCVTSPPYFGLRDYGTAQWEGGDADCDHMKVSDPVKAIRTSTLAGGKKTTGHLQEGFGVLCGKCGAIRVDQQIGLEETPESYVGKLVSVFREVRRVLRNDGVLWLNLGDSYAMSTKGSSGKGKIQISNVGAFLKDRRSKVPNGLKPKDLIGIPWRCAFALQADGWYLRQDIIWSKPNPMPESVKDRCTKSHEYIFLLTKSPRYFYNADVIKTDGTMQRSGNTQHKYVNGQQLDRTKSGFLEMRQKQYAKVNKRSVWEIAPQSYHGAHFATFPEELVETCLLAGTRPGDTVLDPFMGSGTVARVAVRWQRHYLGCELNPAYLDLTDDRLTNLQINLLGANGERPVDNGA